MGVKFPVGHGTDPYMNRQKHDGTMVVVGAVETLTYTSGVHFIFKRRSMTGPLIGGLPETQEMLDFCSEHNIVCDIETIAMKDVNQAYDRTVAGDVTFRFVIDMATPGEATAAIK